VEAGLSARKGLGQHFLRDRRILSRIVDAARLSPEETVIEIGAGLGTLTAQLVKRAGKVVAVEVDEGLCGYLRRRFESSPNLSLVCADVRLQTPSQLLAAAGAQVPYLVVANLPFYIAAPVLRHFLEATEPPSRLVVMVQKEVAESIAAGPGRMSLLGVSVQFYASPRLLFTVPPSAFYPPPKVHSAVLRIDVRETPAVDVDDRGRFFAFLRAGFSAPRKQLRNAVSHALGLEGETVAAVMNGAGVDPRLRAQALGLEEWAVLYKAFAESFGDQGKGKERR
jgi:16S rRNA (adenine1518-N6/adenine1519-N6)-dimethyltransferase